MERFSATVHVHAQALALFVTNIVGAGIHGVQQQRGRDQPNAETIRGRHYVPATTMAERKAKRINRTGARSTRGRGHAAVGFEERWTAGANVDVPRGGDIVQTSPKITTTRITSGRRREEAAVR